MQFVLCETCLKDRHVVSQDVPALLTAHKADCIIYKLKELVPINVELIWWREGKRCYEQQCCMSTAHCKC